ncbi:small integral membrane protein 4 [Phlebotomus argentipes]|uniref:small integral membrane protein 4 n=1 Tax=Phlebotomus argentipes TaxID=94469 RepID=UPI0028933FFD|nr:small integral membrane protein 4 [Phlebotomus argentipes]
MKYQSHSFRRWLDYWPGKKLLGIYRFLPAFFILGAALEFSMINWTVGETNFYNTYKRRQAKNILEERLHAEESEKSGQ